MGLEATWFRRWHNRASRTNRKRRRSIKSSQDGTGMELKAKLRYHRVIIRIERNLLLYVAMIPISKRIQRLDWFRLVYKDWSRYTCSCILCPRLCLHAKLSVVSFYYERRLKLCGIALSGTYRLPSVARVSFIISIKRRWFVRFLLFYFRLYYYLTLTLH